MKKEALLILDDKTISDSKIEFVVSRKYCVIDEVYDETKTLLEHFEKDFIKVKKLVVNMEKVLEEFKMCIHIKSIGQRNKIINCIANEEYFSAIYVNGKLYLKVED